MKKKRVLFLAIILGIFAVILIGVYMGGLEQRFVAKGERVDVLVALSYIPPYTVITRDMLKVDQVPRRYIQPGTLSSLEELIDEDGRNVYISVSPIMLEEQIMTTKLAAIGKEAGLALSLPPGKRAISIQVNHETGIAMLVRPGNNVDVLGTFEYEVQKGGRTESRTRSKVMLQNILVVAVKDSILGEHPEIKREGEEDFEFGAEVPTITLAVSPKEAALLTFARVRGDISFSLRAMGDEEAIKVEDVTYRELFPRVKERVVSSGDHRPAGATSGEMPISIIRGIQEAIMKQGR